MRRRHPTNLLQFQLDSSGPPRPGKFSEMFLEFMQPLLTLDPQPLTLDTVRSIASIAELCWNLPIAESGAPPGSQPMRSFLERSIQGMPAEVRQAVLDRLRARTTDYAAVPVYLSVRIEGTSMENARVVAEARGPVPIRHAP